MKNVVFAHSKFFLKSHPIDWLENDQPKIRGIQSMMLHKSSIRQIDLRSK